MKIHDQQINREMLKDIQFSPNLYLDYRVSVQAARRLALSDVHPEMYGRIYTDVMSTDTGQMTLVFLKYSLVFPYSGLPSEIGRLKNWVAV